MPIDVTPSGESWLARLLSRWWTPPIYEPEQIREGLYRVAEDSDDIYQRLRQDKMMSAIRRQPGDRFDFPVLFSEYPPGLTAALLAGSQRHNEKYHINAPQWITPAPVKSRSLGRYDWIPSG